MIEKVISGGMSGIDLLGLSIARDWNIPTGGTAPMGWLSEVDGKMIPCREKLESFGLIECDWPGFPARTERNALLSDGTLWVGDVDSRGFICTKKFCDKHKKPFFQVKDGVVLKDVVDWLEAHQIKILNVAGPRYSMCPEGFYTRATVFLTYLFGRVSK